MKTINGFSKYQISEDGIVVGPRCHAIAPHINKGMLAVKIHNDAGNRIAVQIHRAVAETFMGVAAGMRVRHRDGNVLNNAVENLEIYDRRSSDEHKKTLASERNKRYAKKYPERVSANGKKWRQENKGRSQANVRNRQARKLMATPAWANLEAIARHYANAVYLTEFSGHLHHVDHIIPLQGKTVCGLHVENNLRAIPHFLNTRKGNKFEGV